jgi:hypothetical protein
MATINDTDRYCCKFNIPAYSYIRDRKMCVSGIKVYYSLFYSGQEFLKTIF